MRNIRQIELIGEGTFSTVYLVKDEKGNEFALKKIKVNSSWTCRTLEKMRQLNHPNLVKVYQHHFDNRAQQLIVLMEYCESGNLLSYFKMKNKKLTIQEISQLLKQIVNPFVLMNRKGIIHRDLKPENILFNKGVVKIGDQGCSSSCNNAQKQNVNNLSLDQLYLSPEQLKGQKYSSKSSVWSFGALVYFLYYGVHPFMDFKSFRPNNPLKIIRQRTENKEIQLISTTDPTIAKILRLTLIFNDKERASWQQLRLSRIFCQKIKKVKEYIDYLRNMTIIANWMVKQFWKIRKEFAIKDNKDQIFAYFMIKFQYTNIQMALSILQKQQQYKYLFDQTSWDTYKPSPEQTSNIQKLYSEHKKYFLTFKKSIESKQSYRQISKYETIRISPFLDLYHSIKICYKIIIQVKDRLAQIRDKREFKILVGISRLINYEKWYSFQSQPKVQKLISENIIDLVRQINDQIDNYQSGLRIENA